MLELLHHKRNHLITNVIDGSILKNSNITCEKNFRKRYHFCSSTSFRVLNYFASKMEIFLFMFPSELI